MEIFHECTVNHAVGRWRVGLAFTKQHNPLKWWRFFHNSKYVVNNYACGIESAVPSGMKRDTSEEQWDEKHERKRHRRSRALTGLRAEREPAIDELYEWLERHGHRASHCTIRIG